MNRKAKGSGFKMRSSNKTSFKDMGSSSPVKSQYGPGYDHATGTYGPPPESSGSSSRPKGDNRNDWFMRKTGGGDWEKVMRKPRGVATGHGSGGYTDDWGETATTGIDEFDAKVRSAKASRRRDAARRFNPNSQPSDSLSGLSNEDFWSQYSF